MNQSILAILLFASAAYGANPDWDGLRITWSPNPLNPWAFNSMPRSLSEKLGEFQPRDNQCKIPNAKFLGQRYMYKQDPTVTLLFDTQGTIAGIQNSIPKKSYKPAPTAAGAHFIDDGDYWTLTAYFVEPSTICASGRSHDQLKTEGTGSGLWFQTGPNPLKDNMRIPLTEDEVKKSPWTFGKCFLTMGNHYFHNITKDMKCDDVVHFCLMYNRGKLTAFCFESNVDVDSPRYEHPTAQQAQLFMNPVPNCYFTEPTYKRSSSIHIYFQDSARFTSLC